MTECIKESDYRRAKQHQLAQGAYYGETVNGRCLGDCTPPPPWPKAVGSDLASMNVNCAHCVQRSLVLVGCIDFRNIAFNTLVGVTATNEGTRLWQRNMDRLIP